MCIVILLVVFLVTFASRSLYRQWTVAIENVNDNGWTCRIVVDSHKLWKQHKTFLSWQKPNENQRNQVRPSSRHSQKLWRGILSKDGESHKTYLPFRLKQLFHFLLLPNSHCASPQSRAFHVGKGCDWKYIYLYFCFSVHSITALKSSYQHFFFFCHLWIYIR